MCQACRLTRFGQKVTTMANDKRKILVGLIGAGIGKSLSPALHEVEARNQGIRLHYQLIDLDRIVNGARKLPQLVDAAANMGFTGLNITYPCKQTVIPLLDELSDSARDIGAVNTVIFRDGKKIGHNTDGSGWAWAFQRALPEADVSRVVLLGAGGAGCAIAHAALRLGVEQLLVVDSVPNKAVELVSQLRRIYGDRATVADKIAEALEGASGLIHATPTGMLKLPGLPLPANLLRPALWVAEVVYLPLQTELLKAARSIGCVTVDGGGMVVGQAAGAFELFTAEKPDLVRMESRFRDMVENAG